MTTRRRFLGFAAATVVTAGTQRHAWAARPSDGVPVRTLGRTGEKVSMVGIGGYHLGKPGLAVDESIRIVRTGLDEGINFLDNCWDYNGGESELRMGKALRDGYRQKAFLMTKIDGRSKATAITQINDSLKRLQTDRIDLLQFHEVIRDTDPDRIFAAGGAIEAAVEARKSGKVRYIGFTGHKSPDIHLKMLATARAHGFTFDSVQMPLNVMDHHFNSFEAKVLPVLVKQNIGVLGMKPMGDPFILHSKTVTAVECLHYSMNLPTSVVIRVAILCQSCSRHSRLPAVFGRSARRKSREFWRRRPKRRNRENSNYTKPAITSTVRIRILSGSVKFLDLGEATRWTGPRTEWKSYTQKNWTWIQRKPLA